jgi:probable HAF family extracellular repeat protein
MRKAPLCLLALCLVSSVVLAQGTYTQIDVPGAQFTVATGIDTAGDVVGYYNDTFGTHGFLLSAGVFTTLDVPNAPETVAFGMNDMGQIVGTTSINGFVYDIRTQTFTTLQYSANTYTTAFAINNAGTIAGLAQSFGLHNAVGFELNGTTYTTVKAPGFSYTALTSINNLGEAIGVGENVSGLVNYFLLNQGKLTKLNSPANSVAYRINDANTIAGFYAVPGTHHYGGFVQQNNARQLLRFPGSTSTYANGINNAGVVVGAFEFPNGAHGFMWTPPVDAAKK